MRKLKKDFYSLREISQKGGKYSFEDLIYLATQKRIELYVYAFEGFHVVYSGEWTEKKERDKRRFSTSTPFAGDRIFLREGCYPILLLPGDRANHGHFTDITIKITHNEKPGYIFLEDGEYAQELCITHEELERFETSRRTIPAPAVKRHTDNQFHDLIWKIFCSLREEYSHPTGTQVWRRLQRRYHEFDTEEIIQEIKNGLVFWRNASGEEKHHKKDTLIKSTLKRVKEKHNYHD